jgi:beta-xylosidase
LTESRLEGLSPSDDGRSYPPGASSAAQDRTQLAAWRDVTRPAEERVADLLSQMTLAEKVGQLYSAWLGSAAGDGDVVPHQDNLAESPADWPDLIRNGLGQLTRPFGTRPVTPEEGAVALATVQREIASAGRFGIPAVAHDECLAGFSAWTAAIYPVPLAWGAAFDPKLVERMAAQIGLSMRRVGIHQGLAPVLDVTVDPRWGRTEETIGEDPYLVATIGTAYVRGLESTGLISTLKHFVGHSASRGGRNLAPVAVTSRQIADLLLPPFEMAIRLGGARSVMHAYIDIDGIPAASDPYLLTSVLRDTWGFTGTVVADYFGISYLELLHGVAADPSQAAVLALKAGVDVELPGVRCYGAPLIDAVEREEVDEALVDRAARRVLMQKCELGLLDPSWDPRPPALTGSDSDASTIDLHPPAARDIARRLAEESIVLLANDGILPLTPAQRIAVIGPRADDLFAMLGCYSFPVHVGVHYPDLDIGVEIPTFVTALRNELPDSKISYSQGCGVDNLDTSGIGPAVQLAASSDICIAVMGDRSGLFGRGTSGEGCDAADLNLPGIQAQLVHALLATRTPLILILLTGRPYALGSFAGVAATVQAFFPGEHGGPALARVLSGAVNPSGHLPVSVPRHVGAQPTTYIGSRLAHQSAVSSLDPSPLYPFGHGLSYSTFQWNGVECQGAEWRGEPTSRPAAEVPPDGTITVGLTIRNVSERSGTEIVQVYLHDPVGQVTRPTVCLIGYARVELEPGQQCRVEFTIHTDMLSFVGRLGNRIVEPGRIELRLGTSSTQTPIVIPIDIVGPERTINGTRQMTTDVEIT